MSRALELTTMGQDGGWDDAYEALAYTAFALATQADDEAIAPLFAEVRGVLADWERIEADRRQLRGAAIAARAHVRMADAALDLVLKRLATSVLELTDGRVDHDLYRRFFPVPHQRVIDLGLDAELPLAGVAMAQLDEGGKVPEALLPHVTPLRQCLAVGNGSVTQRAEAYADLGRLSARIEAWLETASACAHTMHKDLSDLAAARGLSSRWTASFFPA